MPDLERESGALTAGQKNVSAADLEAAMTGLRLSTAAFTGKSSLPEPTAPCLVLLYDPVSGSLRKATLAQAVFNNAALISGRTADTTPPTDAYVLIYDPNTETLVKTSRADFLHDFATIHDPDDYTEKSDPDAADWLLFYDESGNEWFKVSKADLLALADGSITKAKIENLSDMKVLGNVSGGAAAPAEVAILDEDDMASDSATALATQQSIKAYVDGEIADLPGNEFTPATYAGEGSVTLPNGLIMKMGRVTTSGTSRAVSYGSPFPNAVLSTVVTVEASTSLAVDTVISNKTLSSFDVFYGSAATHCNWFAIGY